MSIPALMYGVAINEAIARGNLEEMRELATVSSYILRTQATDLESDEGRELTEAHTQLVAAIAEREVINLAREDVIGIRDSIVVLDNFTLARALKPLYNSDVEGWKVKISIEYER